MVEQGATGADGLAQGIARNPFYPIRESPSLNRLPCQSLPVLCQQL
jgi:hypothetical protein